MIWKRVSVFVACLFLASANSAFSGDLNDFTDIHRTLEHLEITFVKTEKNLSPEKSEAISNFMPRQIVLQSSPNSHLRVTSATIKSRPRRTKNERDEKKHQDDVLGKFYANFDLYCSAEFQWGSDELVDRDVKAPVRFFMIVIDNERHICDTTLPGGTLRISKGAPSRSCAIESGIQLPANFTSGCVVWVVAGADSEGAPWRLLAFHRMSVSR
jgi:hypothetical protein